MPVRRILSDLHPLTWNNHIENLVLLYSLNVPGRHRLILLDLIVYVHTKIMPVTVFQHAIIYVNIYTERIQTRALRFIFPEIPCCTALELAKIHFIDEHHDMLTKKQFKATYCS